VTTAGLPRVIAITGATGFTGVHVVRELRRRFPDATLRCLVRPTSDLSPLREFLVESVTGDLRDGAALDQAFAGADTLVNVASLGFDWVDTEFEAITRASFRRTVFIGTTAVLTTLPVTSKPRRMHAEALVKASRAAWTLLRPTMIYGTPRDRNISRLIAFVRRTPVVPVVAPGAWQQPIHVEDVAAAVVGALCSEAASGRAYNIGGGQPLTLADLVRETARALGCRRLVWAVPHAAAVAGARLYGALARRPRITVEQVLRLGEDKRVDYSEAARDFGFSPRTFRQGIAQELRLVLRDAA
jgi:nucleoside-diphosphate-sugar epimerase